MNTRMIAWCTIGVCVSLFSSLQANSVTVTDIVDGDTIIVDTHTLVQLLGVDALGTLQGDARNRELEKRSTTFTAHFLKGQRVELRYDSANRLKKHKDKWNRVLAYVYLEDGTLFNLAMIQHGYARAYTKYPLELVGEFKKAEQDVREKFIGLWAYLRSSSSQEKVSKTHKVYVARNGSKVYHEASCVIAREIPLQERVTFHEEDEAIVLGYKRGHGCVPVLMKRF